MSYENRESLVFVNEGEKIFGVLHRPLSQKPYPVVLVCHGLGGNKTGKYRLYVHLAEMLTKRGIGCLRIDFRGSGDSEGDFSDMTIETEISDALMALQILQNDPEVDRARIGIFGRSFGGVIAISAAAIFGNIKSLGLWAPVFNGDQWKDPWQLLKKKQLPEDVKEKLMRINGLLPGMQFYEQLFALELQSHLQALEKTPILHIHGEKDEIVNLSHAENFKKYRENAQEKSSFLRLSESDHDFSHPKEQKVALQETADWFEKTL